MCMIVLMFIMLVRKSSEFSVRNCDTEIHTTENYNLDLVITCVTSDRYYRCQLRENHDDENYDMCMFKFDQRVGRIYKPHCTTRLFRRRLYWKYDQAETSCKIKLRNVGGPETIGNLMMLFKETRHSNDWTSRKIEMSKVNYTIQQLNNSIEEQNSISCDELKVEDKLKSDGLSSDILGIYDYQIMLLGYPVFRKYINVDQEIYLYWNSHTTRWIFSPGIGSKTIWASSECYGIDPTKCTDWTVKSQLSSGIRIICDNTYVPRKHNGNLPVRNLSTTEPTSKVVNNADIDIKINDKDSIQETQTNHSALFGLIGGCICLFGVTMIVGIVFSRKRRKRTEMHQHGAASPYSRRFVDFYLKHHLTERLHELNDEPSEY